MKVAARTARRVPLGVAKSRRVTTAGGRVGQWWTPTWLARALAAWAGVQRGMRVVDAGAGMGALSLAAAELGAEVTALEVDQRLADRLVAEHAADLTIVHRNFLEEVEPRQLMIPGADVRPWPLLISNPPWEGKFPELFVSRAVSIAERACFILPVNVIFGAARASFWRSGPAQLTRAKALANRPRFKGAKGGMRDVVLIEVVPRVRGRGPVRFEIEVG